MSDRLAQAVRRYLDRPSPDTAADMRAALDAPVPNLGPRRVRSRRWTHPPLPGNRSPFWSKFGG